MGRKVKYDYVFKLECVELVSKKHYSIICAQAKQKIESLFINKKNWIDKFIY